MPGMLYNRQQRSALRRGQLGSRAGPSIPGVAV